MKELISKETSLIVLAIVLSVGIAVYGDFNSGDHNFLKTVEAQSDVCQQDNWVCLNANPDANSTFEGWSGCSQVQGNECRINLDNGDRTIGAYFHAEEDGPPLPPPPPPPPQPECNDGADNDGDELIDYPDDPDCDSPNDDNESGLFDFFRRTFEEL